MRRLSISFAFLAGLAGPAIAADPTEFDYVTPISKPDRPAKTWDASLFVYGWAFAMSGQAGLDGLPPIDVDVTFEEFFNNLDAYGSAFADVRRGRFGVAADFLFADVSDGITILSADSGDIQVKMGGDIGIATVMGEYRVWEQQKSYIDLMAGARLWYFKDKLEVIFGASSGSGNNTYSWVDPMIGAKMRVQCNCPFFFNGWAMIGGLGASSNIDWDVFGGLGYEFNDHKSILAGYRAIGVDYEDDGLVFDIVQHGPIIGALFDL